MADIILKHNAGFLGSNGKLLRSRTIVNPCTLSIGDSYGGGIVIYKFITGDHGYVPGECHGIIAMDHDLSSGVQWYNGAYTLVGGTLPNKGYSIDNTNLIVSTYGNGFYAAKLCVDHVEGIYNDWVLPTSAEITWLAYSGASPTDYYWSSFEEDVNRAGSLLAGSIIMNYSDKALLKKVRAVRYY